MRYLMACGGDPEAERLRDSLARRPADRVLDVGILRDRIVREVIEFRPDVAIVRLPPAEPSPALRRLLDIAAFGHRPVITLATPEELERWTPPWARAVCLAPFTVDRVRRVATTLLPLGARWEGDPLVLRCGDVELSEDGRSVRVAGRPVVLTFSEFEVLDALMRRPGIAVPRAQLMVPGRGAGAADHSRAIDVYIRRIRHKLRAAAAFSIETVPGVGYRCVSRERDEAAMLNTPVGAGQVGRPGQERHLSIPF